MASTNQEHFKETDIRPQHLAKDQAAAMTIDIGRLLMHFDKFVEVNCPACDATANNVKYRKYGLTFTECTNCKTFFTNPRPTEKVLEEFYKHSVNYEYWNEHIFPMSEEKRRQKIFVPRVDKTLDFCQKYNVKSDALLEIGAAFGTFCLELKSRQVFKKIVAVEPTPGLAETLRRKGIDVIQDVIENISFNENDKFDVVVNFEVIEHIFSPRDFINHSHRLLKKGGILIITCPNGKGFDFEILGEKCNSLDHEHLNYFNPQSLPILLDACGFDVLETITPGKLDAELVRNKVLSGEFDLSTQPFLNTVLIDKWDALGKQFQDFLADNQLSSNLWIVARAK